VSGKDQSKLRKSGFNLLWLGALNKVAVTTLKTGGIIILNGRAREKKREKLYCKEFSSERDFMQNVTLVCRGKIQGTHSVKR